MVKTLPLKEPQLALTRPAQAGTTSTTCWRDWPSGARNCASNRSHHQGHLEPNRQGGFGPHSLLASAFDGGGAELSVAAFASGSALLLQPAMQGLDKIAKALGERPAPKLTVVGTSRLLAEGDAYQRDRLQALLHMP